MTKTIEIDGVMIYRYVMPGIESNMYLITQNGRALIVDPHICEEALRQMREQKIRNIVILLTHEHFDHISGVNWLREEFRDGADRSDTAYDGTSAVCVIASEAAAQYLPDPNKNLAKFWEFMLMDLPEEKIKAGMALEDKEYSCNADQTFPGHLDFEWNGHMIHMQPAPGHSPGGMLIFFDQFLFSGDNLVNGSGVICRIPGGNWKTYCEATRPMLERLADNTWILPGHGGPGQMKQLKKYMQKFGHVKEDQV